MGLAVGTRLGPYEILAPIGAGGMGEVYRARDTKLDRDVAIKVLPPALAQDPERLARFEREAKVLASLNHPNIAAVYGLQDGAIVMELVEGPTLSERLVSGPIPLDETLKIAAQIADALEVAHDRGIVHRDLKPANVKASPEGAAKVLDFGLATAAQPEARVANENSPTLTIAATEVGIILGTAAYMSPEQAAGKAVDKRSDIWSFGVLLWEMLTGTRLFAGGETVSHTLADVLRAEIDFGKLPASTPAVIRQLLKRCLDRNAKTRLRDMGEARVVLANPTSGIESPMQPESPPHKNTWLPWAVVCAVAIIAATLGFVHFREPPPPAEVMKFEIPQPEKAPFGIGPPVLSPDGRKLAFVAQTQPTQIWIRSLDALESRPLPGTEGANATIFWSPDSHSIAFWTAPAPFKLKRADLSGGPAQALCDTPNSPATGSWGPHGVIIFHTVGISRVPAVGGDCTEVTKLDESHSETNHRFPSFLPDGRHFLYFRQSSRPEVNGIYVGSLDVKPEQQTTQRLMASESGVTYVSSSTSKLGYVLFLREGTLMARPFNPERIEFAGDAVPVADHVAMPINAVGGYFSVSETGGLAYRAGLSGGATNLRLTWFDRRGNILGRAADAISTLSALTGLSFSPNGEQVAFTAGNDARSSNQDVWVYEFAQGISTRFTFDPAPDGTPVWSPDGKEIVFASDRDGGFRNLYRKAANNAGTEELLLKSSDPKVPSDWSRDGRFLLFQHTDPKTGPDIWYLPMAGPGPSKPEVYLNAQFAELYARFSPDTRLVAYTADASGVPEVYVQTFPNPAGGKWMVSKGGGTRPAWRRDGKELFFLGPGANRLMAVDISLNPSFKAGVPKALFDFPPGPNPYDASGDGTRFVKLTVPSASPDAPPSAITIVLNWQAALKK